MKVFTRAAIISFIYSLFYNLPIQLVYSAYKFDLFSLISQMIVVYSCTTLLFMLLLVTKPISYILIPICFALGGASDYYLLNFKKILDNGVIIDALSVENELILEYMSFSLVMIMICSCLLAVFLVWKIKTLWTRKIFLFFAFITAVTFTKYQFDYRYIGIVLQSYQPFSLFHGVHYYFKKYLPEHSKSKDKRDLTKEYSFELDSSTKSPLYVVLIIGESMRGDLISLNGFELDNTPLLKSRHNLISFTNAWSSGTLTRISLPFMLTSAVAPNIDQSLSEKSVISIFKSLGFATSWIGNQGLYGSHETTYASNALEAEYVISLHDIKRILSKEKTFDEDLLKFLDERINENPNQNHFIVLHLYGSHWHFNSRYPSNFLSRFTPICDASTPYTCETEALRNSYFNTIAYTDYVVDQILKRFEDKDAFVLYSSDHGLSLRENGEFGNGYSGENVPYEQSNIAMFAWMSDAFLADHKAHYSSILAKREKQIGHDIIFHSLLDCSGVKSSYIEKQKSICEKY